MTRYLFVAVCVCFSFLCTPVVAHNNPYTIRNIEVKKTAESSADAKKAASQKAKQTALGLLLQKLVSPEDFENLKDIDDETVDFLVDSVQIRNEQLTSKAYKASFSFEFNKSRVEAFLREKSIIFVSSPHKPILVLPVLSDGAKSFLFEQDNKWFSLWKRHTFNNAILTFLVPYGDLQDMQLLNAEDALIGATHKLKALVRKYRPNAIIVPYVSFMKEDGELSANLTFQEFDEKGIRKSSVIKPQEITERATEASKEKMLQQLLDIAIQRIQSLYRVDASGEVVHHTLFLKMKTPTAKVYFQYVKLLENSSMVRELKPIELSKEYSVIEVTTFFAAERLIRYFEKRGYHFELADQGELPGYLQVGNEAKDGE